MAAAATAMAVAVAVGGNARLLRGNVTVGGYQAFAQVIQQGAEKPSSRSGFVGLQKKTARRRESRSYLVAASIQGQTRETQMRLCRAAAAQATETAPTADTTGEIGATEFYVCAPITEATADAAIEQMVAAKAAGATLVELRIDYLDGSSSDDARQALDMVEKLITARTLPAIVTFRPSWEGGKYTASEDARLAALERAMEMGVEYIDVELKAAAQFLARPGVAALRAGSGNQASASGSEEGRTKTKLILSHHNYKSTPLDEELQATIKGMVEAGCDVAKIAAFAEDISDSMRVLNLLLKSPVPAVLICMGPRGQVTRLLAPKFGSLLTFGSMGAGKESAPGQSTVQDLVNTYGLVRQSPSTKIFGLIGNPVSHSKGPILHNASMRQQDMDGVYVPFLVDDVPRFLASLPAGGEDFAGFSVTIPHKEIALECCSEVDPLAASIGAVNTLVRKGDGTYKGYNTDCSASISAIEAGLRNHAARSNGGGSAPSLEEGDSPLKGKAVVVLGAGGAGRAVAFGAVQKGARVLIANRRHDRAVELASAVGGGCEAVQLSAVQDGSVAGDVLANTTSLGMYPNIEESPLAAGLAGKYKVVFDAVYNPLETKLLKDAAAGGATIVSGVEMFVGQAADQFVLFTGKPAPRDLMMRTVLDSLGAPSKK